MSDTPKETKEVVEPALKLKFLSHGTLEVKNIENSRRFFEEFMGMEVIKTSNVSLMIRLGGIHIYAAVESGDKNSKMPFLYHNGLDVLTDEEVNECHKKCSEQAKKWGLHHISKPSEQHGTYSFYFWDLDDNCWEILSNPEGGYSWLFEQGDLEGRGHLAKGFDRSHD
jgi:predicted lactoylglutathione lyase